METFPPLLAICMGISPVAGEFPAQRPVTRSFDVWFDLRLTKRLRKQLWGWWFEAPVRPLWRHYNGANIKQYITHTHDVYVIIKQQTYGYQMHHSEITARQQRQYEL